MDRIVFITPNFAVTGQLAPEDFAKAAAHGFTAIVNNRPDGEEEGQLSSAAAQGHARLAGLAYQHNPSGKLDLFSDRVVDAAEAMLRSADGPVLAYCKSGMRCAIIWAAANARSAPVDEVVAAVIAAGYTDFEFMRDELDEQARKSPASAEALAA